MDSSAKIELVLKKKDYAVFVTTDKVEHSEYTHAVFHQMLLDKGSSRGSTPRTNQTSSTELFDESVKNTQLPVDIVDEPNLDNLIVGSAPIEINYTNKKLRNKKITEYIRRQSSKVKLPDVKFNPKFLEQFSDSESDDIFCLQEFSSLDDSKLFKNSDSI